MSHLETAAQTARENLDFVAGKVRPRRRPPGDSLIYFLWAILVPIGFALPDFAPRVTGVYWFVAGILGGLASMWLGARAERQAGTVNREVGRRYGWHWCIGAVGFFLAALPMFTGAIDWSQGASLFLLVGGIIYLLAGVHLDRGMLPSGVLMLVAYVVLLTTHLPYVWTVSGLVIAVALAWVGFCTLYRKTPVMQ